MADYQSQKVNIFSNINDIPIAPTSSTGGNISHLYNLYNQLIDLLETDINTLQSTSVTDYSTDITNLQTDVGNLQSSVSSNTNNISTNTNNITTNLNSIGTLNTNFSSLQTSANTNASSISAINSNITAIESDITTINANLGVITESFVSGTSFYLDLNTGSDSNDGLTDTTPFLTLDKLISTLNSKHIPQTLTINIKGVITETIDFSNLSTLINAKGKDNRATITITTNDTSNFTINNSGTLIKTNNNHPLKIIFSKCDFIANNGTLNIINSNSYFRFNPPCNFDTTASNTESILYCENTDIHFDTFGSDLVFNNSSAASLECAVKLVHSRGKFEKCTINDIGTFVIADENSFVINDFNSNIVTNVTTQYDLKNNSSIRTNRYSILGEPGIIIDGTSTINNFIIYNKTLINPSLINLTKILNNARKDYYVRFTGVSGFYSGLIYEIFVDSTSLASNNYKLDKGSDLNISFSGSTSVESIIITLELHDFV